MNNGMYKHMDGKCIYWYKTWKNSTKNSGSTMAVWNYDLTGNLWDWVDCEDNEEDPGDLVGAACLARW